MKESFIINEINYLHCKNRNKKIEIGGTQIEEYKYLYKIIAMGDGAVGKTAIITRYTKNFFREDYKLTIGVDFHVKTLEIDGEIHKMQLWDFGGQERFQLTRTMYCKGALGAVLLFDLTRKVTFQGLPGWIKEIREGAGDIPIILIGNKRDLQKLREVSAQEARDFANMTNCHGYLETSAKTGENVEEVFEALARVAVGLKSKEQVEPKPEELDFFPDEEFSKEQVNLINLKIEEILTRPTKEGEFRFLIFGNENSQKPLLSKLLRVEKITWPPKTQSILYNTLNYTMKIDVQDYNFQLYFLSNLKRLEENHTLFNEACKSSDGVVIFYDSGDFNHAADTGIMLREKFPDLEIILTTGFEISPSLYHKLEGLEEEHQIHSSDDYNTLISEVLINTLKRKKKIDKEIKYMKSKLKKFQDQLSDQRVDRDKVRGELKEFILSMEKPKKVWTTKGEKTVSPESVMPSTKNMIFISYSHKDSEWLERVQTHLKPLEREGKISRWDDTLIRSGEKWREKITKALKYSKVAILLISPEFLASDFIVNNELPPLLEAAGIQGTKILPVIISPSRFEKIESLSRFQAVNDPQTEPLVDLNKGEQDKILVKLSNAVEDAFK